HTLVVGQVASYQVTFTTSAPDCGVRAGTMLTFGRASTGRASTTSSPTIPAISMAAPAAWRPLQTAQSVGDPRSFAGCLDHQSRGPTTGTITVVACESQLPSHSSASAVIANNPSVSAPV